MASMTGKRTRTATVTTTTTSKAKPPDRPRRIFPPTGPSYGSWWALAIVASTLCVSVCTQFVYDRYVIRPVVEHVEAQDSNTVAIKLLQTEVEQIRRSQVMNRDVMLETHDTVEKIHRALPKATPKRGR